MLEEVSILFLLASHSFPILFLLVELCCLDPSAAPPPAPAGVPCFHLTGKKPVSSKTESNRLLFAARKGDSREGFSF